jgi:esterase
MDLHFEASGQGDPLYILHGLFGSSDNWQPIARRLGDHFTVIAVDQRNHGRSPHHPEMNYHLMAEDLLELMHKQGNSEALVLGHSMGGKTAMQLALSHPKAVRKLVIVDIAPRKYPPSHLRIISGMRALDLSHFQSRKEMQAALSPAVPDVATRQFLLKNVTRDQSGGFSWKIGLEEIRENYLGLTEAVISASVYDKPTLFLRGEKSDFLLEPDADCIRKLFPSALLQTIPGAGHLLHVQNPEAFMQAVMSFLLPTHRDRMMMSAMG